PGRAREPFITCGQNRLAAGTGETGWGHRSHRAPQKVTHIDDEDDDPGELTSVHVGSPPVRVRTQRMHVCPKSTSSPNIIGQAPAITLMSWRRHQSTASREKLRDLVIDWCIQTRGTPASTQSWKIRSVTSGR